ncbi:MAG: TSUP family transporter, partial [Rhodococcus sp. (in: high G+C Gram-positive bacteria)]
GGGLILLPAILLVAPQLAPQAALATNKMTAVFGTFAAVVTFSRRIALDWRLLVPAGALAAVASAAGAAAVSLIDRELFIPIIMVVLIAVAALVTARPTIGSAAGSHAPSKRKTLTVVFLAAGGFGFYDGILGPGTGTFFIIAFATLLGTEFVRSAAMAKVLNLGSNLGALAFFAVTGHVLWQLGAAMAVCNVIGAVSGSRIALARGSGFVRVVLLVVVFGMVIRLGWQQFG